jgi:hypothetical protein
MTLNQHLHAIEAAPCRFGQQLFAEQAVVQKQMGQDRAMGGISEGPQFNFVLVLFLFYFD